MSATELSVMGFLSALSDDELAEFRALGRTSRFGQGEAIFHDGDDPGGVIAIVSGRVKVSMTAEIANTFVVSHATVKTHVARILMKLHLRDRVQAVIVGYECGIVRVGEASK